MDRKISKFAVGDEVVTAGWIKTWAIGTDQKLRSELIEQITENEEGFRYQTSRGGYYNEDQVFPVSDAKKIALKFLAECMIVRYRRKGGAMPPQLIKCGWCPRDCYPNELRYSKKLDCMVCPDCDCDNDITHGEIQERKRQQAKESAWNEGCGWVK